MAIFEEEYWWFRASRKIYTHLLNTLITKGSVVLDVGCGTGLTLSILEKEYACIGIDQSLTALYLAREKTDALLIAGNAENIPLRTCSVDCCLLLDVLEHVEDDLLVLCEAWRVLKPGGIALITVPANPFLWSEHDEALGHKRRYTKAEFRKVLVVSGFHIRILSFYNTLLALPIALYRVGSKLIQQVRTKKHEPKHKPKTDLFKLPYPINKALEFTFASERYLLQHSLPWGISLLAVVEKRLTD